MNIEAIIFKQSQHWNLQHLFLIRFVMYIAQY